MELSNHLNIRSTERCGDSQSNTTNSNSSSKSIRKRVRPAGGVLFRRLEIEDPDVLYQGTTGDCSKNCRTYLVLKPTTSLGIIFIMLLHGTISNLISTDSLISLGAITFVSYIGFHWNQEKVALEENRQKILNNIHQMKLETNFLRQELRELEAEIPTIYKLGNPDIQQQE